MVLSAHGPVPPGEAPTNYGLADALERTDWDAVAELIHRHSAQYATVSDQVALVAAALSAMPPEACAKHPELWPYRQLVGIDATDTELRPLDQDRLRAGGEAAALELRTIRTAMLSYRLHGRLDLALALAEAATPHAITAAERFGSPAEAVAAGFCTQVGNTYLLLGDLKAAQRCLLLAWQWRHREELSFVNHEVAVKLAALSATIGYLRDAEQWLEKSRDWPSACAAYAESAITFAGPLAEFVIATERLDFAAAEALVPKLAHPTRSFEFFAWITHARMWHFLLLGRPLDALALFDEATPFLDRAHYGDLDRTRVEALLAAGRIDEALALLEQQPDDDVSRLQRARAAAIRLDHEGALAHLDTLSTTPLRRVGLAAQALRATCQLGLGRPEEARRTFSGLLDLVDDNLAVFATVRPDSARALFALCRTHPRAATIGQAWLERARGPVYPFGRPATEMPGVEPTERELVMLGYIAAGISRTAIARRELVSINTVKTQIAALYRKLGAANATEAVVKAQHLGWL